MDEALGGLIASLIIISIVLYIIAVIVAVSIVLAMIALGIMSFFMARSGSGKALVPQRSPGKAFWSACSWAGTLAVGCMIGSIGLLIAMHYAVGNNYGYDVYYQYSSDSFQQRNLIFFVNWIAVDALNFFVSVTLVLYLANRISIARKLGGSHWLGLIPPLGAMVIFFFAKHWKAIVDLIQTRHVPDAYAIVQLAWEEISLPFVLLTQLFQNPDYVTQWGYRAFLDSDASFFQLGEYFPSIFVVILLALFGRCLFETDA